MTENLNWHKATPVINLHSQLLNLTSAFTPQTDFFWCTVHWFAITKEKLIIRTRISHINEEINIGGYPYRTSTHRGRGMAQCGQKQTRGKGFNKCRRLHRVAMYGT